MLLLEDSIDKFATIFADHSQTSGYQHSEWVWQGPQGGNQLSGWGQPHEGWCSHVADSLYSKEGPLYIPHIWKTMPGCSHENMGMKCSHVTLYLLFIKLYVTIITCSQKNFLMSSIMYFKFENYGARWIMF